MNLKIYAVRDSKIEAFMKPFYAATDGEALRIWADSVNAPDSGFYKHPEDYCLFQIGEYDTVKGTIGGIQQPRSLGLALEFINQQSRNLQSIAN